MLRRLYDGTMAMASGPSAEPALAGVAFVESSFFPIPPDLLLVPMVLAEKAKAWRFAIIATIASVLGGLFGYFIGAVLFEQVARPLIDFYGYGHEYERFAGMYNDYGIWIVLIAGLTPFPYKVITIASGATGLGLPIFIITSIIARGIRFFAVAGLLYFFGPPARTFIEKNLGLVFTAFMAILIGGFVAIKFVL